MSRDISYLRLSITDQCDMACGYCMPSRAALPHVTSPLTVDGIATLVEALARCGVRKVRLTGGEPLVRRDVVDIVRRIASIAGVETLGLTTNASRLSHLAGDLKRAGLQRLNISLDTLDPATFRRITGHDTLDEVLRGIDAALRCSFDAVKLNTVVMRGINDQEVPAIAGFAGKLGLEARFIELMPLGCGGEAWRALHVPAEDIAASLGKLDPLPYEPGSSARRFVCARTGGVVGLISPVSHSFCADCNRIRVSCSGKVKPCLRLPVEEDLRPLIGLPDLADRLAELLQHLGDCKLTDSLSTPSAVQADAMCAIGG